MTLDPNSSQVPFVNPTLKLFGKSGENSEEMK
jgi:hypothetical protein